MVANRKVLKLTKKADYSLLAMQHLARYATRGACSAKDVAAIYGMPQEALAKILQRLTKAGLLASQHGANGGYALARDPQQITALEVIRAVDGPLFMTACSGSARRCDQRRRCTVREPLLTVSRSIEQVLSQLTIWELSRAERKSTAALATLR